VSLNLAHFVFMLYVGEQLHIDANTVELAIKQFYLLVNWRLWQ